MDNRTDSTSESVGDSTNYSIPKITDDPVTSSTTKLTFASTTTTTNLRPSTTTTKVVQATTFYTLQVTSSVLNTTKVEANGQYYGNCLAKETCTYQIPKNASLKLTAILTESIVTGQWLGACASVNHHICNLSMDGNKVVSVYTFISITTRRGY